MDQKLLKVLKEGLILELDTLLYEPKFIILSPEFHVAMGRPEGLRGVPTKTDGSTRKHWKLEF